MPNYGKKVLSDFRKEVGLRTPEGTADFSNPEHLKILAQILDEKETEMAAEGTEFGRETVFEHMVQEEMEKLKRAPIEGDTRIIKSKIITLGVFPCKYEYWTWDGAYAETVVFLKEHVQNMSDEEIVKLCNPLFEDESTKTTLNMRGGYVFVNFNFYVG